MENAPKISELTKDILSKGSQILLPFNVGDASICFNSRWKLAEMIEAIVKKLKNKC